MLSHTFVSKHANSPTVKNQHYLHTPKKTTITGARGRQALIRDGGERDAGLLGPLHGVRGGAAR